MRNLRLVALLAFLLAAGGHSSLGAADPEDIDAIYNRFICTCSCNQLLGECNMIACPNSGPMRAEVRRYLDEGRDAEEIVAIFTDKYGLTVLSAPPTSGWFNISAWIMPFLALVAGVVGVGYFVRRFSGEAQPSEPAVDDAESKAFQSRLERELADYVPED